jgi:glycosyltransferase involved in cell wall biosynthesis
VEGVVGQLAVVQIAVLAVISVPVIYWIIMRVSRISGGETIQTEKRDWEVCILLPMKNEKKNVIRKIESVIEEIISSSNTTIVVVDSGSNDGTAELAKSALEESGLNSSRWRVLSFSRPGKSVAINRAMEELDAEIIVMSDADARVYPGWFDRIIERLGDEEVGVVSGMERPFGRTTKNFTGYYREKSNFLRCQESYSGSTPVLEGSLMGWKVSALGDFRLNEGMNADDAQIGLQSIRMGYRSIVDEKISFSDFDDGGRTIGESIRRSQGLSLALLSSFDLVFLAERKARMAIINAIILYVIFPWMVLIFAVNSVVAFSMAPVISTNWPMLSLALMAVVLTLPQGRSVCKGVFISLVAHMQILVGRRYHSWDPVR